MMNRRKFIARVVGGIAAAYVATRVPLAWMPEPVRKEAASKYLTTVFNNYMRGKSAKDLPLEMWASEDLFDALSGELVAVQRFVDNAVSPEAFKMLLFKSTKLKRISEVNGWKVWIDGKMVVI